MTLSSRRQALEALLAEFRPLWQAQPFRERQPAWCERWPALSAELAAWPQERVDACHDDAGLALAWLVRHFPQLGGLAALSEFPESPAAVLAIEGTRWAKGIPGRKLAQIEAFAAACPQTGAAVLDWCGGKGHLGRLLAWQRQVPVHTLEIDTELCRAGQALAGRLGVDQQFVAANALTVADWPRAGQHAVALHACGELHRHLLRLGAQRGVQRFDVAPCCYYRGVEEGYAPLASGAALPLRRDDLRLAVTETVTASPRLIRQRDKEMAWKLGFDSYRGQLGEASYRPFRPVPAAWFRGRFADFMAHMAQREGLPAIRVDWLEATERDGWRRQREVMRLSVVRQAFRRAIEAWLVLDLALFLEERGYRARLTRFCHPRLTPRNLLLSAERL